MTRLEVARHETTPYELSTFTICRDAVDTFCGALILSSFRYRFLPCANFKYHQDLVGFFFLDHLETSRMSRCFHVGPPHPLHRVPLSVFHALLSLASVARWTQLARIVLWCSLLCDCIARLFRNVVCSTLCSVVFVKLGVRFDAR